jgi:predicted PurR-regulated permease PerM
MGTPLAFALAVLFAVLCYALLIWLERHGSLGLERLMRWVCE